MKSAQEARRLNKKMQVYSNEDFQNHPDGERSSSQTSPSLSRAYAQHPLEHIQQNKFLTSEQSVLFLVITTMSDYKDNLSNMLCLDVYLSSLSKEEYKKIKHKIKPQKYKLHPLLSADIHCSSIHQAAFAAHQQKDWEALQVFEQKANWTADLKLILTYNYYALVLTDATLTIQWANKNFKAMTGYPINYAIGKSPKFLQGKNTSEESRQRIRQLLTSKKPFTENLINYRKNQEEYACEVKIFPLLNAQGEVTHFLALENEIVRG